MLRDLTGKRFGKLIVLSIAYKKSAKGSRTRIYWNCKCDCGKEIITRSDYITSGQSISCGCSKIMRLTKHGESRTRLYRIYDRMKQRCYNPNHEHYKDYGGRGIIICNDWLSCFDNFSKWAKENGYNDFLTLDRINPNEIYCPDNCRWVNMKIQNNNKRNTIYLKYNGENIPLTILAEKLNIPRHILYSRYKKGWENDKIIFTPINKKIIRKTK